MDKNWREILTPQEFRILRERGTEAPFTGEYDSFFGNGQYVCRGCGAQLFSSDYKYDSGCGWPAFDRALDGSVELVKDNSFGMERVEVTCKSCGGHLGHVFPDGPTGAMPNGTQATGQRFCINSASLKFKK